MRATGGCIQPRSLAATVAASVRPPTRGRAQPRAVRVRSSQPESAQQRGARPARGSLMTGVQPAASAPRTQSHGQEQQDAHRRHASRGNSGRGAAQRPGRGVRLRIGRAQAAARQHLPGEGHARRAVAAGGLRRLRRQPPRLPGLQRNPSRLLPDPGRRPAGAAAGGGRSRGRSRGRGRCPRRGARSRRSRERGGRQQVTRTPPAREAATTRARRADPTSQTRARPTAGRGDRTATMPSQRAGARDEQRRHVRRHEADRARSAATPPQHRGRSAGSPATARPQPEPASSGGHVEEIASDTAEAPETVSTVEQVGSEDALEEVPERPRRRMRSYKIQEVIKRRQIILVQVVKEERGSKGAALTTYLSLAGRYTVLMPNTGRGGGISRKITNPQDSKRLKAIAHELEVPEGMGLIIRTAGAARTKQEIKRDFEYLLRLWENVRDLTLQSTAPCLVYEEGNLIKRSIRDLYSKDIDEILVAGEAAHTEASDFMRMLSPSQAKNVIKYEEPEPLFARYPDRAAAERHVQPLRDAALGRLSRHQPDRGAGFDRRQLRQGDARVLDRGDGAQHQPGGVRGDRPPAQAARPRRPHRHRLHRHGGAAQQPQGREPPQGCACATTARASRSAASAISACWRCRASACAPACSRAPPRSARTARAPASSAPSSRWRSPCCARSRTSCCAMRAHSLTAVTTAEVALYILNNKRAFVTDMERRYGITITVQASDRMQGANFAIERSAPRSRCRRRRAERAVVNMEWGFEGQEADERRPTSRPMRRGRAGDGRRPRRRRARARSARRAADATAPAGRRGRRDEPEQRPQERSQIAHNGSGEAATGDVCRRCRTRPRCRCWAR